MNYVQMLDEICSPEFSSILALVKFILNTICIVIPVVLIVLIILDLAKIVTAGNIDDKLKKEVTSKVVTRVIFAVLIFLVPTIVKLVFGLLPLPDSAKSKDHVGSNETWKTCWDNASVQW